MAFASITVGDWGLSFVQEFTDDVQQSEMLNAEQVALAITGTVVSVLAAFIPMVNFEKVGANVGAAEAKIGSMTGGHGLAGIESNPKAIGGTVDPESDPAPPGGSDLEAFWADADHMEGGSVPPPVLDPGENWAQDFSYVDTRPVRNPRLIPPAINGESEDEDEGISLTPDIGRREAQVLLGTIPGKFRSFTPSFVGLMHIHRQCDDRIANNMGQI